MPVGFGSRRNTLGNLGFVIAGMTMFAVLARDEANDLRWPAAAFYGNQPIAMLYAASRGLFGPRFDGDAR